MISDYMDNDHPASYGFVNCVGNAKIEQDLLIFVHEDCIPVQNFLYKHTQVALCKCQQQPCVCIPNPALFLCQSCVKYICYDHICLHNDWKCLQTISA